MSKGAEGFQELFWVYFPEARYLLQNYFTYNEKRIGIVSAQQQPLPVGQDDLRYAQVLTERGYADLAASLYTRMRNTPGIPEAVKRDCVVVDESGGTAYQQVAQTVEAMRQASESDGREFPLTVSMPA